MEAGQLNLAHYHHRRRLQRPQRHRIPDDLFGAIPAVFADAATIVGWEQHVEAVVVEEVLDDVVALDALAEESAGLGYGREVELGLRPRCGGVSGRDSLEICAHALSTAAPSHQASPPTSCGPIPSIKEMTEQDALNGFDS